MSILEKIKSIGNFSIIFIPEDASHKTRSTKLSFKNLSILIFIYTFLCVVAGFYILSFSGLNNYLLPSKTGLNSVERQKVEEVNSKVIFLIKELEKLKATNKRLKYALELGDTTLFDSLKQVQDSINENESLSIGGNILQIIEKLFFNGSKQNKEIQFIKPVTGFISRGFNPGKGHMGLDYVVKEGTPVYATAGGYVVFSGYTVDDGYTIIISHSDEYMSIYKHLSTLIKKQRESVEQGELIAISGNSGKETTGPHLHFEIWKNGKPVDPRKLILNY
jgi:murein DD-endopeptidase MepM/ murein hydrolase activator NlpD